MLPREDTAKKLPRAAISSDRLNTPQIRVPADLGIAGEHYRVGLTESGWQLQPLAPTSINGTEVASLTALSPGDQITAGSLLLEFVDEPAATTPPEEQPEPETLAVAPPTETAALLGALEAARSAPKEKKARRFPKFAVPAAAAILLLGGGAFAAWKSGLLPFGKGDPHFALLADYAPAGSDYAVSIDIQDIGKFYDHWQPKLGPSLPTLAEASQKMKAQSGVGIEAFERISLVGSSTAIAKAGATGNGVRNGVVVVLTVAEGTDVSALTDSENSGATKKDTGEGFSLYHIDNAKGMAGRLIDNRHFVIAPVADQLEPSGSMSAKSHIKTLRKSGQTLTVSGSVPAETMKQLPGSLPLPTAVSLGIDLPAGIDVAVNLEFGNKEDAEHAEDEFEKLRGMIGMFAKGENGDMVKSVLNRLLIERKGKTQTLSLSFGETELALMANKGAQQIAGRANTNKIKRNAQNLASVYASSKAAGSPVWQTVTTKQEIAEALQAGVPGGESFASTTFKVPDLSDQDLSAALQHLDAKFRYFPMDIPGAGGAPSIFDKAVDGLISSGFAFPAGSTDAKAKRNAQNIVSVYSSAVAAGSSELSEVTDAETGARKILEGVKGGKEAGFDTTTFQATMTDDDLKSALEHITWDDQNKGLSYSPKG